MTPLWIWLDSFSFWEVIVAFGCIYAVAFIVADRLAAWIWRLDK